MKTNYPVSSLLYQKSTRVWCISAEATVFDAIKFMAEKNIGALPVMSNGKLLGIFTERDYTRKVALEGKTSRNTRVRDIISTNVISVTSDHTIEGCMRLMTEKHIRHLPVIDEGTMIGLVSIGDMVNWIISAQSAALDQMEAYLSGR